MIGRATSKDQKQRRYERLGCHKPVITMVTLRHLSFKFRKAPTYYTSQVISQSRTRVKLSGVFFPVITPSRSLLRVTVGGKAGRSRPSGPYGDQLAQREAASAIRKRPGVGAETVPDHRGNPFRVLDPFCRLPLPTLFHRREAFTLGARCGYESTAVASTRSSGFSKPEGLGHQRRAVLFRPAGPTSGERFQSGQAVKRKE
ncbi:hypothetical protein FNV43_RR20898 [Rhamnella rubrinervis]|uniref:Uncharacterized protein n=1 Tax=Rhamnella rubrinervis TaxID=2594499 RepID=A0A8K0E7E0_9ROSA|nr:hypothetical protein FNV43_RR20898 [Rhamnella rubrinervis]